MNQQLDYAVVDGILAKHGSSHQAIIAILQDIQEVYHYLPQKAFPYLADKMDMSEARIYSVATFYENFSLEPKGKYIIKVCDGTACHVRRSAPILERIRSELGLSEDQKTTDDLSFTVETVACLGACGLAPAVMINDKVHPSMTPDKASALINELKETLKNAD
ncbi:MAG: NAD(P)H-dependent oxidoreductase subunit E [Clostridia bacterium]|nr:NAD(P)H-dependent oxidoreductase subunit E [Clostridia bacterium]